MSMYQSLNHIGQIMGPTVGGISAAYLGIRAPFWSMAPSASLDWWPRCLEGAGGPRAGEEKLAHAGGPAPSGQEYFSDAGGIHRAGHILNAERRPRHADPALRFA